MNKPFLILIIIYSFLTFALFLTLHLLIVNNDSYIYLSYTGETREDAESRVEREINNIWGEMDQINYGLFRIEDSSKDNPNIFWISRDNVLYEARLYKDSK